MPIDLGIGQDDGKKAAESQPIPVGTYQFQISEIRDIVSQAGRPGWNWFLKIIQSPDPKAEGRIIFYRTYFPWINPSTGAREADVGMLSQVVDGTNSWDLWSQGGQLSDKEMFYGRMGFMKVSQKKKGWGDDPEGIENKASIVTKKK